MRDYLKTRVTEILGCEYPIIQGGMAWVADHNLAAAVSEAGGIGLIAAANADPETVRTEIRRTREITDKNFGVNIMLMSPFADEIAQLVIEEGVKIVTTGAGDPRTYIKKWKEHGICAVPVVASVSLARMVERSGADAVIVEGMEAGGHIGQLTTMSLVPQVADAVTIPVIAAGGIADERGYMAVMMLGAEGVQIGTRFLAANETNIHENYKNKVIEARDMSTTITGSKHGHPVRSIKNRFTRSYQDSENEGAAAEMLDKLAEGTLRRAVQDGNVDEGTVMAGQIAGLVKKKQSCDEIIKEITSGVSDFFTADLCSGAYIANP